ncbi:hypothetical protein V2J09_001810, partial [Rumex salicifolius]
SCLDLFCGTSGQRINVSKSKLFVSRNLNQDNESGFTVSDDLGIYLGFPLLNKAMDKDVCRPLLEKICNSGDGVRKMHMVNKEDLCKPKALVGLALR